MSVSGVYQAQLFQNLMLGLYALSDMKNKRFINESIKLSRDSLKENGKNTVVKVGKTRIRVNLHLPFSLKKQLSC